MDRTEFLQSLATLSMSLNPPPATRTMRDDYVASLVELAKALPTSATSSAAAASDAFQAVLKPNARDMLWRIAGATLERRRALTTRGRDALRVLETSPDLLSPLRLERTETAHSSALAFLLDPSAAGVLGRTCLAAFIDLVLQPSDDGDTESSPAPPTHLDLAGALVSTERGLGRHGRVDISIDAPAALIFIELKVDANEGPSQLTRYGKALDELAGNRDSLLVFVTVDDDQTSDTAYPCRHVTYRDLLVAWLPIAVARVDGAGYLAMYLKTIAAHLLHVAGAGEFDRWELHTQRAALAFIEQELGT